MLTQLDLQNVARQARARGLHSSWVELLEFSQTTIGSLVDAYQALLRDSNSGALSHNPSDLRIMLKDNLSKALTSLTSETQVAKWESEILGDNGSSSKREDRPEGI